MRRRPLKARWCLASQEVLPRVVSPYLLAEHKTAQVEGVRWSPTLRLKSTSSSLIKVVAFTILRKKSRKSADSGEEEDWEARVQRPQYRSKMGL